jgi:hypothetical protein
MESSLTEYLTFMVGSTPGLVLYAVAVIGLDPGRKRAKGESIGVGVAESMGILFNICEM